MEHYGGNMCSDSSIRDLITTDEESTRAETIVINVSYSMSDREVTRWQHIYSHISSTQPTPISLCEWNFNDCDFAYGLFRVTAISCNF